MARLDFNFQEIPETIKPITPGKYTLEVAEAPTIEPTAKGTGQNLIINFRITDDGEFKGRSIRDYIYLSDIGLTTVKQLMLGCGIVPSANGFNTEEFIGKRVNTILVAGTFTDKTTEKVVEVARVGRYLHG